jgi:hypothetical protein
MDSSKDDEEKARRPPDGKEHEPEQPLVVYSITGFDRAEVLYKVKVENRSDKALAEIKIKPYLSKDIFLLDREEQEIALLKPGESKSVSFRLRPRKECGNAEIQGKVTYYDMSEKEYIEVPISAVMTSVVCPIIRSSEIDGKLWRKVMGHPQNRRTNGGGPPTRRDPLQDSIQAPLGHEHAHA